MSDYTEFFLNSTGRVVGLDLIELSHSSFSKTWRLVRNATDGITVKHEDSNSYLYTYCPMKVVLGTSRENLDQTISITLGDLGDIIQNELERIEADDSWSERPMMKYRYYSSENLNSPIYGPILLEMNPLTCTFDGSNFEATAPSLNVSRTGEIYTLERFPMLRGFL